MMADDKQFIIFSAISLVTYAGENLIFYKKYRKFTINFKFVPYLCLFIFLSIKLLYSFGFAYGVWVGYNNSLQIHQSALTLLVVIGLVIAIDGSWSSKIKDAPVAKRGLYTILGIHFSGILINLIGLNEMFDMSIKAIYTSLVTMITGIGLYKVYISQRFKMFFKIILMYVIVIPSKFIKSFISLNYDGANTIKITQKRFYNNFNLVPEFLQGESVDVVNLEFLIRWAVALVAIYIADKKQVKDSTKIFIFFSIQTIIGAVYTVIFL